MSSRSNNQRSRAFRRSELINAQFVPSPHHRRIEDYFQFDVSATYSASVGQFAWNVDHGTVDLGMAGGNVIMSLGLETYFHVKADSTISCGQVVMATGTLGNSGKLKAAPANITDPNLGIYIIGVAAETIPTNSFGYVTCFGTTHKVDTTGNESSESWSNGTVLYYKAGTSGKFTSTKPIAPNPHVLMAIVLNRSTNGSIFVRLTHGLQLGDINGNVQFGTLGSNDFIVYNSGNSRWENQSVGAAKTIMGLPSTLTWYSGTGSPEGVVTATVGCLYSDTTSGATDSLFVKKTGTGNTGWTSLG